MGNKFRDKVVEEDLEAPRPEPEPEVEVEETQRGGRGGVERGQRGGRALRGVTKVLGGDMLGDKVVLRQIPLLLLCLFYLLLLVGNRYRIESLSIEKQAAEERINYLREQRIQMQKQYQQSVKISQIAEDLRETGVGITAGPPYELDED